VIDETFALAEERPMQDFVIGQGSQKFIERTEQIVRNAGMADGHAGLAKQPACQLSKVPFLVADCETDGM
jgi:hypothetical protein